MRRRALFGLPLLAACKRDDPPAPAPASSSLTWTEPVAAPGPSASAPRPSPRVCAASPFVVGDGKSPVVALVPERGRPDERFPVLVALHGQGEARKGPERGAWGWVKDYELDKAHDRLSTGKLTRDDLHGFVTEARLAELNRDLAARPFAGLVVLCAYTPDLLVQPSLGNAKAFGRFVFDELLPAARARLPIEGAAGVDGVSLGGRVSLLVGFAHAEHVRAIGALQAAIQVPEARRLAKRAKAAREKQPDLALRLVTSERDFYKDEIQALHDELAKEGVPHEHRVLPGPHDYPWNKGPGAIEMLLFHDRALRGRRPV